MKQECNLQDFLISNLWPSCTCPKGWTSHNYSLIDLSIVHRPQTANLYYLENVGSQGNEQVAGRAAKGVGGGIPADLSPSPEPRCAGRLVCGRLIDD